MRGAHLLSGAEARSSYPRVKEKEQETALLEPEDTSARTQTLLYFTFYTSHCTLYIFTFLHVYISHFTFYILHFTLCISHFSFLHVYTLHFTPHTIHFTLYALQFTIYALHFTLLHFYILHFTVSFCIFYILFFF